mmetsp:Transcript_114512/g.186674  ORF Transcript_114512/g.186674 Transcript_114512/m.186674 type:complete len:327 (-) Transcript_114512:41-1021(-)
MQTYNMQHGLYQAWTTRTPLSSKAQPFVSSKVICDEESPRPRSESPEPEPSPVSSVDGKENLDLASAIPPPPGLGFPLLWEQQGSSGSEPECEQSSQDLSEEPSGELQMQQARDVAAAGGGLSGHITVMVRYIPSKYTQNKFMNEINDAGFDGTYDFLYLPLDTRNYGNRGFAFINFLSAELAELFYSKYHGQKLKHFENEVTRDIAVMPADVQGFEESAARFYTTSLRKKKNQGEPVFLKPLMVNFGEEGQRKGRAAQKEKKSSKPAKIAHHVPLQMEAAYMPPMMASPLGLAPPTLPPRFCGTCGNLRVVGHSFCQYCGDVLLC